MKKVFLVHGEEMPAAALTEKLKQQNMREVYYPDLHSSVGNLGYNLAAIQFFVTLKKAVILLWEGARVVEWDGLENRCGLRSTEGSNPSLPAN